MKTVQSLEAQIRILQDLGPFQNDGVRLINEHRSGGVLIVILVSERNFKIQMPVLRLALGLSKNDVVRLISEHRNGGVLIVR